MCLVAGLAVIVAAPLQAAEPDIIKQVPPDAQFVFIIPNLAELSDKVTKIAAELNLPQPELQQPLDQIRGMMGVEKGFNESGGLAVILPRLPVGGQPEGMLLLPVSDYAAFVGNFGVPNAGEGVTQIEFQGQPAFIKKSGKYAVLSLQQQMVEGYTAPTDSNLVARAGQLGGEALSRGDTILYIDISQIGPMFIPIVQMQMEQAKMQMQAVPQSAQMAGVIDLMSQSMQAVLRDGQSVVVTTDISTEGFGLSAAAQFKPGSPLAQTFAKAPAGELAFDRLPDKPFFFAASMNTAVLPLNDWLEAFAAKLPADMPVAKIVQSTVEVMQLAGDRMQAAMYTPNLGAGGGLFNTVVVYQTPQPDKFIAGNRKMLEEMNNLDLGEGATIRTQYEENAVQVEGVKRVDRFRQQTQLPPEAMAQLGPLAGLMGQEQSGYIAPLKDAVVVASGADPTTLKDVIAAAGGGGKLGGASLAAIRPKLLGSRSGEMYVGVGPILQFVNGFLSLMAPQAVIDVPADLPPVGSGLSVGGGGIGTSVYVPMAVVQTAKRAVDKFQSGGASGASPSGASSLPRSNALVATLTDANFEGQVLQSQQPVVVDFYAVWSNQSKSQASIIDELAKQYQGRVKVGRIDIDENPETIDLYGVETYPTVLVFKNGVKVAEFVGLTPREKLDEAIRKALQ